MRGSRRVSQSSPSRVLPASENMQYTLGDLDAIYTEQQDSSLLLNIEPQHLLEQVMTECHDDLENDTYETMEPQPSVSKVVLPLESDDSKDFISEPQGLLIDNDVDVEGDVDVDVEMDLDIDLSGQLDLNITDTHEDPDYESD